MTGIPFHRSPDLLHPESSSLVIIDLQTKLTPVIPQLDAVLANCVKLLRGAELLQVPCLATEQYPKGLGPTIEQIAALIPERREKLRFSAAEVLLQVPALISPQRPQIVLAGIETHVCVLQTALDLLAGGYEPFIVVDAVESQHPRDREIALQRLSAAGARLVTTEMVLFEWCEIAGSDLFRQLSRIVTGRA